MNANHSDAGHATGKSKRIVAVAAVLLLLVLVVSLGASGAFASLKDTTSPVTVDFVPVKVSCVVNGDYSVKNSGDIPALIRVKLICNWVDAEGNVVADAGALPVPAVNEDWQQLNGFLYYRHLVAAGEVTVPVIAAPAGSGAPEGLHLQTVILAEAIQAEPDGLAAREAWNVRLDDGSWKAQKPAA